MERQFEVTQFTDLIKYICNRGFDGFRKMYQQAGLDGEDYVREKWELVNRNFMYWWCELSSEYQEAFIIFSYNFYENL